MPVSTKVSYDGFYHCSPECWVIYSEVLRTDFRAATEPEMVRQKLIDAYAVQHAGGKHPDKSVAVHLVGLHAAYELRMPATDVPSYLQRLMASVKDWPHFRQPMFPAPMTIFDVALAESAEEHVVRVETWAEAVWHSWLDYHKAVASFVQKHAF